MGQHRRPKNIQFADVVVVLGATVVMVGVVLFVGLLALSNARGMIWSDWLVECLWLATPPALVLSIFIRWLWRRMR